MIDKWNVDHNAGMAYGHDYRPYLGYTREHMRKLPTLTEGQADDLKIDTREIRVWFSRCTVEDGEPFDNKVTIEARDPNGDWRHIYWYAALPDLPPWD